MSTTTNTFDSQPLDQTSLKTGPGEQQGYVQQAYDLASKATAAATAAATTAYNTVAGTAANAVDPTTNYRNHQQHVGGVGDLGTISTSDVVRLPEERANPDPLNPPEKQFRNRQDHIGGVGDLGTRSEADVVRLPEERANPEPYTHPVTTTEKVKDSAVETKNKVASKIDTHTPTTTGATGATDTTGATGTSARRPSEGSSPTSPSMKDKIKGKILVAEGKLTKNADKIEHGKALQQGVNPTA